MRDVTVSNSTWGNRLLRIFGPRDGVHALGGGIGLGLSMAIGAALAAPQRKTVCLVGDGGLQLSLGELATLVQEKPDVLIVLMNDRGYGVIRNIWDAHYGGRRAYSDLHTPDFARLAASLNLAHKAIRDKADFRPVLRSRVQRARADPGRSRHAGGRPLPDRVRRSAGTEINGVRATLPARRS